MTILTPDACERLLTKFLDQQDKRNTSSIDTMAMLMILAVKGIISILYMSYKINAKLLKLTNSEDE